MATGTRERMATGQGNGARSVDRQLAAGAAETRRHATAAAEDARGSAGQDGGEHGGDEEEGAERYGLCGLVRAESPSTGIFP